MKEDLIHNVAPPFDHLNPLDRDLDEYFPNSSNWRHLENIKSNYWTLTSFIICLHPGNNSKSLDLVNVMSSPG